MREYCPERPAEFTHHASRPPNPLDSHPANSYAHSMIQRYSRPEMRAIWTDENKFWIWLQIELLASEALVEEMIVPAKDFDRIKAGAEQWSRNLPGLVERAKEIEKIRNHDVIAFTEAVNEKITEPACR